MLAVVPISPKQLSMLPEPHLLVNRATNVELVVNQIDDLIDYLGHGLLLALQSLTVMYQWNLASSTGKEKGPRRAL